MSESIERLIKQAQTTSIRWLIDDLWQRDGIALIHSLEEQFKSVLAFQIAESIAAGSPLLRLWKIPQPLRVGILNTEMGDLEMGKRLERLYPRNGFPEKLVVSDESVMSELRNGNFQTKIRCLQTWVKANRLEALIWDTANSVLSAAGNNPMAKKKCQRCSKVFRRSG